MPIFQILVFLCLTAPLFSLDYKVKIQGLEDKKTKAAVQSTSQLFILRKRPPASLNALKYRADSDIPVLLKLLEAHGYYEANVKMEIREGEDKFYVTIAIDPGPLYTLEKYNIHINCPTEQVCCLVDLKHIGITLGMPARTETILNGELKLLTQLASCGYPLAEVEERSIVVDGESKTVRVDLFIGSSQRCFFGPYTVTGEKQVKPLYIERKIAWKEGDPYNSDLVEKTQNALIDSGLFSSVLITHDPLQKGENQLPMRIDVTENKYKSINLGVSYQTVFGPGITGGWEHRNIAGMGRTLSIQGDLTRISQTGIASYHHPDFLQEGQDYIAEGEAGYEKLFAYLARSYSVSNRIDSKYGKRLRFSFGLQGEHLLLTESVGNGNFWLVEVPLYVRWSTANDYLNPTKGITLEALIVPSMNISEGVKWYALQEFSESTYLPLTKSHSIVLAQKITLGMGWYQGLSSIPLSKRFLGGSEQELRGYRYRTVSPLIDNKPEGGGSAVYGLLEARFRLTKTIGLVPFFDIGNVYTHCVPTSHGKWLKSVGLGARYFSFMGPFRLDVAVPLNRRKGIDPVYKILVSIGQTF